MLMDGMTRERAIKSAGAKVSLLLSGLGKHAF